MKKILSKILTLTLLAVVCFTSFSSIGNIENSSNSDITLCGFDDEDNSKKGELN